MDGKRSGEVSMSEKKARNSGGGEDMVITICTDETPKGSFPKQTETLGATKQSKPSSPSTADGFSKSFPVSSPSPEIARFGNSPGKPPRIPSNNENIVRKRSLSRSVLSKPKSRFGEQPYTIDVTVFEENSNLSLEEQTSKNSPFRKSLNKGSSYNNNSAPGTRSNSINQKTPLMKSPAGLNHNNDDEEEINYKKIVQSTEQKKKRVKPKVVIEWIVFLWISGCLIASLTVEKLKKEMIRGLEVWKWCVLVMVIFCGMLVTNWCIHFVVFLIECNFLLKKKVLYFVHGLKKSVQVFIWIGLILLAWFSLFNHGVQRSETATKILDYFTWTLVTLHIGTFLWLLKTLLLKILASNFHVNTFFERIQESVFHQYVLRTLSGPPLIEEAMRIGRQPSTGQFSFRSNKKGKGTKEKKVIDMGNFHKIKQQKVSSWTMKVLVDAITKSGLSTISNTLDELVDENDEQTDTEITNEMEATSVAYQIFYNVAHPGSKYIEEADLLRFMIKEEVELVIPLFEVTEPGKIDLKALTDWVLKVYNGRKALAHALSDTKTAVKQLNKLVTVILIIVTIVIWLLLMQIATTKVLVLLSSQLVVAAFMFKNTCKTIFEAIIFVFVMHPFDVGDRCVVDGVPLLVEEMNILTTVFLKLNNEKVYFPNSVLATKPISNYYRSPNMGDTVDFSIDFGTPVEKIGLLKEKIASFLQNHPHWHPIHNVVVIEIENVNKLKMALYCTHTMNFQEFGEKNKRRSELVIEIKKIFEEVNIKYYLLPQQVHLRHIGSESTNLSDK